eukprot:TRINITY_DN10553_c0_g1_i3.p1 TRINITY_DN10553_c0_g1~~TRINITY_DN10553_c0_g1_i3.p1  ORF type:complete len:359 (+),score=96.37 TRINITY_DN10553_c0_g1_i3:65-1141(+)
MWRLACCVLLAFAWPSVADYYKDLGLEQGEDSTDSQIKKAYRSLSKKYHPDHNPTEEGKARYAVISRAYEVLSDAKKRKIYDMKGEDGLKQLEESQKGGGQAMDPFAAFFGGQQRDRTKGKDMRMTLHVTMDDLYNGKTDTVTIQKQKLCRACKGSGAASKGDIGNCHHCKGRGVITQQVQIMPGFVQNMQQHCPHCGGTGKRIKKKCPVCNGNKVTRGSTTLEFDIERGTPEGHELRFEMEADESPDVLPGDVIFKVQSKPHSFFSRRGDDLEMTMTITLLQALVGFTRQIRHMDDHVVEVKRDKVTPFGTQMVIRGEGMPRHNVPSEKGDLKITFHVNFPKKITAAQAAEFRELLA